jgi:riboflavin biosynthesis pyrimidine reductase
VRLSLIQPLPAVELAVAEPDGLASLADLYRPMRPDWLRINLIQSLNGAIVGVDGTSNSLSNRIDRKILGVIRSHAEVILVGAQTVRAEGHVLPLGRDLAVVTSSGDLSGHNFVPEKGRGRLLVLYPEGNGAKVTAALAGLEVVLVPLPSIDDVPATPQMMISALRSLGYRSIVCEGGRSLVTQLVDAGVVDELCLTIAPILAGIDALGISSNLSGGSALSLGHLLADDAGVLYSRWTVAPKASSGS